MPLIRESQAIILHFTKYGDSGAIIHAVDSIAGRQSYFFRGIGKSRGGSAPAHFHPLNVLDVLTAQSPHGSMPYLKEYSPIFQLDSIRCDISKNSIALFISEVIYRSLRSDDGDTGLFSWLAELIVKLNSVKESPANLHLWFLAGYSIKSGFRPKDNYDRLNAPIFDIISAQFRLPTSIDNPDALFTADESLLLHRLLNSTLEEALTIPLSATRRQAFAKRMIRYLSYHFGVDLDIRSLKVLHDIFA